MLLMVLRDRRRRVDRGRIGDHSRGRGFRVRLHERELHALRERLQTRVARGLCHVAGYRSRMNIGFIGLGAMGLPMTRHIVEAGHDVTVASRSRVPIDMAVAAGAADGETPAGVVDASEVTLLCVPRSSDVVDVPAGATQALGGGKIVVTTWTIEPPVEREQHERRHSMGTAYK